MNGKMMRRNPYGAQRWRNIVILLLSIVILLLIAFIVAGNLLYEKNQSMQEDADSAVAVTTAPKEEALKIPTPNRLSGYAIDLTALDANGLSEQLSLAKGGGYDAIALNITDQVGKVLYRSSFSQHCGYESENACSLTLESLISRIEAQGFMVTGYMWLQSRAEEDELKRSVLASNETGIICEAFRYGIDEVVIQWGSEQGNLQELYRMEEDIHAMQPDAVLGFAAEDTFFSAENSIDKIEELCRHFDFLGIRMRNAWEGEVTPYDYVNARVVENLYHILRYRIRVFLPSDQEEGIAEELKRVLLDNDVSGWQFYIP